MTPVECPIIATDDSREGAPARLAGEALLRKAFVGCVAMKPETHNYHGTRQMRQIGG